MRTILEAMEDYYWQMAARSRLLYLQTAQGSGLCTFFCLQDVAEVPRFYHRTCWSLPPDSSDGPVIYIDKLVSPFFTRLLWREIEWAVTQKIPSWTEAVWYRPGPGQAPDRCYHYARRRVNVADET